MTETFDIHSFNALEKERIDMKAMIVVDVVKGFINKETKDGPCAMYLKGADKIIPNIRREVASLSLECPVVLVCDTHKPNDKEFEKFPPHCIEGTEECLPMCGNLPKGGDKFFNVYSIPKTRYSGFYKTHIDRILRRHKVTEVIIVGVCTDICVFATALDAFYRGYKVTIVKDCVFALDKERGEMCLKYLKDMAGVEVR
jgi:nicotinamidase/pyrazinamidase